MVLIAKYPHKISSPVIQLRYTRATEFISKCPVRLGFKLVFKRKIIVNKWR
jgi:hypothetical protein